MASPAKLVGLLADEQRLRVFSAIGLGARSVESAADAAGVDVATVQTVLPRLVAAGLVDQRDGLHVSVEALERAAPERPPRQRELPDATDEQQRVLRNFLEGGRLVGLPARQGQRRVILEHVAGRFEPDRQCAEPEVNALLKALHDDHVSLWRYLVDEGLLDREAGVYRRV